MIRAGVGGWVLEAVQRRDHGVCALCGADAGYVARVLWRLSQRPYYHNPDGIDAANLIRAQWGRRGSDRGYSLWEADHIVPVAEGGGGCDLDGYRTLCVPCHRAESAKLAKRLGLKRRRQRPLPIGESA